MFIFDPPDDSPLSTSVPCIAELSVGGGSEYRMYGPFASLHDAREWCARQDPSHFRIIPLRRTDKERVTSDSWYYTNMDDRNAIVDEFFPIDAFIAWEEAQ